MIFFLKRNIWNDIQNLFKILSLKFEGSRNLIIIKDDSVLARSNFDIFIKKNKVERRNMFYTYSYRRNILIINLRTWYIYNVSSWQYSHLSSLIYSPLIMNEIFHFVRSCRYSVPHFLDLRQQICNSISSIFKLSPLHTSIILTFHILASILFYIFKYIQYSRI